MISEEMKTKMAKFCFTNLTYYLYTGEPVSVPEEFNTLKAPVYVSWLKNGEMRGCIGTSMENPLGTNLQ